MGAGSDLVVEKGVSYNNGRCHSYVAPTGIGSITLEGYIENGQVVFNQQILFPEGMKVRVELLPTDDAEQTYDTPTHTQFEHYKSIIGTIDDLPKDFAVRAAADVSV